MRIPASPSSSDSRRIDLHCHSLASNRPADAALKIINCPESYSAPAAIYCQAKTRGMDFVTITDHDSVDGIMTLLDRPDVLTGEELTCFFPEDNCKMHIVIWGLSLDDHTELQHRSKDVYQVAEYI